MQLGRILSSDPGMPTNTRSVKFDLLVQGGGQVKRIPVSAQLCHVLDSERSRALRMARENTAKDWPAGAPTHEQDLEEAKCLLMEALRDEEDPSVRLVDKESINVFRVGLSPRVVRWLVDEYDDFLKQEYPDLISPEQRRKLEEEAEKNSQAGQR